MLQKFWWTGLVWLLSISVTQAQLEGEGAIFYLSADYDITQADPSQINSFYTSFNDYWGNKLSVPYDTFGTTDFRHPNFGAGFRFFTGKKVGFSFNFFISGGRGRYIQTATWVNNLQNETAIRFRDTNFGTALGINFRKKVFLDLHLTGYVRTIDLTHTTIYQDGSRSITSEYKLNGVYTGVETLMQWGPMVTINLGGANIFARWSIGTNLLFQDSAGLLALLEEDSHFFPPTDLPQDYRLWAEEPVEFLEKDLGVKTSSFGGGRVVFGLEFFPWSNYNKQK
ncbi:MAG: hypothetical protein AAFU33_23450 [Bacteroidota bacterium]